MHGLLLGARAELIIAGVDEAGRGPLAGPVVAAAVVLDPEFLIAGLADSKTLSPKRRDTIFGDIARYALDAAIGVASVAEIDELNILQASLLAMKRAVENLRVRPHKVLVDGIFCPPLACHAEAIVKGDRTVGVISAASVIAKVTRDRMMLSLDREFPGYGFARHKGYPTAAHLEALRRVGPTSAHRRSFAPVRQALRLRQAGDP